MPHLSFGQNLDFYLLLASQAFCFWGYPRKWTIEFKGQRLDGWWALVACFQRAIEIGIPILSSDYLANLSIEQARKLFAGSPEIPLFQERVDILRRIGNTLSVRYGGAFAHCFEKIGPDSFDLLEEITTHLAGFDDTPSYKGRTIYFFKKAQVALTDFNELLVSLHRQSLQGIDQLTGHADYKIPALLRKLGILQYDVELARLVDSRTELKSGSEMEVEIRAQMLWSLRLICKELQKKGTNVDPSTLGGVLWVQSQTKSSTNKPYHLTKTIYY